MCPHCRAFITSKDRVCPYCNETVGPRAVDRRPDAALLGGLIPAARFNTVLILVINFGIYIATMLNPSITDAGVKLGFHHPYFEWWRLVTAGFFHGGMFHILMNSWVLFDLGTQVDMLYGSARMWVIYFCSSVAGFALSAWWSPNPSLGASAALCGLIGAMIALGIKDKTSMGQSIRAVYVRWAIYLLLWSFLPGIDMAAHIGGGIAGFAIAWVAGLPRIETNPVERLWRACSWFCVILTVVSFLKLYLWFTQVSA